MAFLNTDDGTEIFYNDWGTGTPVVLIHGWPLSSDMWEYQAKFLAENGCRVITYDRRGFGRSSQPWEGYDYDTLTDDLRVILEELDVRGATLVGFSMGGGEVVRYLSRFGNDRVSQAVLVSAVTPFLMKTEDNPEGVDPSVFEGMIDGLEKDRPAFLTEFGAKFYGRTLIKHTVSEPWLNWTFQMAMQGSGRATLECVDSWSGTDFRADCAKVSVPTLVIHGTGDSTVPIDVAGRRAAALIPGARLVEYDGEPHGLFATAPDRLNQDLLGFLHSNVGTTSGLIGE